MFKDHLTFEEIEAILKSHPLMIKVYSLGTDIHELLASPNATRQKVKEHGDWISVPVENFRSFLDAIIELLVKINVLEFMEKKIEDQVNIFIADIKEGFKGTSKFKDIINEFTKILFSSGTEKASTEIPNVPEDVALSHVYVSLLMANILYESLYDKYIVEKKRLQSLQIILVNNSLNPILAMKEAYNTITLINYKKVFYIALRLNLQLFNFQDNKKVMNDLTDLINLTSMIISQKLILKHDFLGHIYHKITGDIATRKGYATYYTKSPIATLLANLALNNTNENWTLKWSNLKEIEEFRVCDFACGSGTLISAVYSTILEKYYLASLDEDYNRLNYHYSILTKSLWGFDALMHAVQTAYVILSLHEPSIPILGLNIYHKPVSPPEYLGSLDLFGLASFMSHFFVEASPHQQEKRKTNVPNFDLIIMNPPFSRSTAPGVAKSRPRIFDFILEERGFSFLWKKYGKILESMQNAYLSSTIFKTFYNEHVGSGKTFRKQDINPVNAGASVPFLFLADQYLKDGGRLALVMPKTVIESAAYFFARLVILANYSIEYIIISEEEGNYNFSYSTGFSEVLLILKKRKPFTKSKSDTKILKILKQPENRLEALILSRNILKNPKKKKMKILGSEVNLFNVSRKSIEKFVWNWSYFTDLPGNLIDFIDNILNNKIFNINMEFNYFNNDIHKKLNCKIVNPRTFRGKTFNEYFSEDSSGRFHALKKAGRDSFSSILLNQELTTKIVPLNSTSIEKYNSNSGNLLIPETVSWSNLPFIACYSESEVISSVCFVIKFEDDEDNKIQKALSVWLNSIYSLIFLKPLTSTVIGTFGHFRGWHIRKFLIPNLLDPHIVEQLSNIYEKYHLNEFPPLRNQFEDSIYNENDSRLKFDLEILLSLDSSINEDSASKNIKDLYLDFLKIL